MTDTSGELHTDHAPAGHQRTVRAALTGWVAAGFALLTLAVLAAPVHPGLAGGLIGSRSVGIWCIVVASLAAIPTAIRVGGRFGATAGSDHRRDALARFAFFVTLLLCIYLSVRHIMGGSSPGLLFGHDAPQYFAYLHSWVFDRDLDFTNEYAMIPGTAEMMLEEHPESPGYNSAPIGTAVLWLPFYLAAHPMTIMLQLLGAQVEANGMSAPYAMAAGLGSAVLAWLGVLMVYSTLRRHFSARNAFVTGMLLWLATPLVWYGMHEVWMSHAASYFAAALVIFQWDRTREQRTIAGWAALGAAIGLAMLVRPDHAIFLLLPVCDLVGRIRGRVLTTASLQGFGAALTCAAIVFSLQLATWWSLHGLHTPPGSPMQWGSPALLSILFSSQNGLIATHPITWLGFLGLIPLMRRDAHAGVAILLVLLGTWYANSAILSWYGGASFGMRRFVGVLPFMALPMAAAGEVIVRFIRHRPYVPAAGAALVLVAYNFLLIGEHREARIRPDSALDFGRVWGLMSTTLHNRLGNPFAYPANVYFAITEGVHPAQYDVLGGAGLLEAPIDVRGDRIRPYLGAGWEPVSAGEMGTIAYMADAAASIVLLPLREHTAYDVVLEIAVPPEMSEGQDFVVLFNGNELARHHLDANETEAMAIRLDPNDVLQGINRIELRFTRMLHKPGGLPGFGIPVLTKRPHSIAALLGRIRVEPLAGE